MNKMDDTSFLLVVLITSNLCVLASATLYLSGIVYIKIMARTVVILIWKTIQYFETVYCVNYS